MIAATTIGSALLSHLLQPPSLLQPPGLHPSGMLGAGPPGELVAGHADGLFSFLSPSTLIADFFSALTSWVVAGTSRFISVLFAALDNSTQVHFGSAFQQALGEVTKIAVVMALPFLVLATIQAILRQDLSMLLRAVFVRLPVAFLLAGAATALVSMALGATDECCNALLAHDGTSVRQLVSSLVTLLGGKFDHGGLMSGFSGLVIAVFAIAVALVLWVELAFRSAAVMVATLFLPIALAGLVWSATAHWARRLAETLAALILAKLVIVGVFVVAAGLVTSTSGLSGLATGLGLFLVAVLSPFSVLRMLPMIESGAVGHLEGLGRRGARAGAQLALRGGHLMSGAGKDQVLPVTGESTEDDYQAMYEAIPPLQSHDGSPPRSLDDPLVQEIMARQEADAVRRRAEIEAENAARAQDAARKADDGS